MTPSPPNKAKRQRPGKIGIDIDADLKKELKKRAIDEGRSLGALMEDAARLYLSSLKRR